MANKRAVNKPKEYPVKYKISKIRLLDYYLMEPPVMINKSILRFVTELNYNIDKEASTVGITLGYKFYEEKDVNYLTFKSYNEYHVASGLENLELIEVKKKFLLNLAKLSINHTRGLQATIIEGTFMSEFYIPFLKDENLMNLLNEQINNEDV